MYIFITTAWLVEESNKKKKKKGRQKPAYVRGPKINIPSCLEMPK